MKYLLDTQTVIWSLDDNARLSKAAREVIDNETNEIAVTIVSLWEIAIKRSLKKLDFKPALDQIQRQIRASQVALLPITIEHLDTLEALQYVANHRDPFDRLIISQAKTENLTIITSDPQFANYPVDILW